MGFLHVTRYSETGHEFHSIRMGSQGRKTVHLSFGHQHWPSWGHHHVLFAPYKIRSLLGSCHSCYFTLCHVEMCLWSGDGPDHGGHHTDYPWKWNMLQSRGPWKWNLLETESGGWVRWSLDRAAWWATGIQLKSTTTAMKSPFSILKWTGDTAMHCSVSLNEWITNYN